MTRRIAWGATLRCWLSWGLVLALVSVADAKPKSAPRKPDSAERREAERKRARERAIQECIDDRDGDPDADREICEDEVGL